MQLCLSDGRFKFGKLRLLYFYFIYFYFFWLVSFFVFVFVSVIFLEKKCRCLMFKGNKAFVLQPPFSFEKRYEYKCMLTSSSSSISSAGDLYTNCCCSPSSSSSSNVLPSIKDNFLGSKTFCFFSFPLHPNFECGVWRGALIFFEEKNSLLPNKWKKNNLFATSLKKKG